jgi:hypothetical protein
MNRPTSTAPKCVSNVPGERTQLIDDKAGDSWAGGEWTTCNVCGSRVRFRVRATDRPPSAKILPHRTDGTPTR